MAEFNCDICKKSQGAPLIYFAEEKLSLCESCAEQLHTCRGCAARAECLLEKNPKNIPPYIVVKEQRGGIILQAQKVNPKLIEEYCKGCRCYIGEICCRRTLMYCTKWELHNEYKGEHYESE